MFSQLRTEIDSWLDRCGRDQRKIPSDEALQLLQELETTVGRQMDEAAKKLRGTKAAAALPVS
jgi:hypothetical protein